MKEQQKKKTQKADKPKYNMWQNTIWIISFAWKEKERKLLLFTILSPLFYVATNLAELYIIPTILGAVERHAPIGELVGTIVFFVAALIICKACASYIGNHSKVLHISFRQLVIAKLFKKDFLTSYPNIHDDTFINLSTHAMNSSTSGGTPYQIWQTLVSLLKNIFGFLVYLMLLTTVNPILFAMILITSTISYLTTKLAHKYHSAHLSEASVHLASLYVMYNTVRDTQSAKDIRIFGLQPWLKELHQKSLCAYETFYGKVHTHIFWANVADLVLTFLRNGISYAYLIGLVLSDRLSVSEFLLYFTAVSGFAAWVSGILDDLSKLHLHSIDVTVLREMLDFPEPFLFEDGESLAPEKGKLYELKLEQVSFRYPNTDKDIIHNIDLTIRPGEKIAVVGLNGAGKTTLVKLLCGFLDPTKGRVLLDGKDVRAYNRRDYYKMFSAVFQDFLVLPISVAANIAQKTDDIDMVRVKDCIDKAGLKQKIESEPNGYDSMMERSVYSDAITLSGGETQRLMLARALYKDAPFVVLDEPTAALDPLAESDMYQKYNEMTHGKSSVYISHRLASTRFCDRILLLENGGIAEEGTHDCLLQKGGKYAELFATQSRYYKEGGLDDEE